MAPPRSGMARSDDGAQAGQAAAQLAVRVGDDLVLAVVRAGGDQQRAAVEHRPQALQLGLIDQGSGRIDLQVAGRDGGGGAERLEAVGQVLVLRQHQREAAEQRASHARIAAPAAERALGHARVDERQRDVARRAFQDQVGPDLRLGEHGEIGPPVVEEAAHVFGRIERRVLVHGSRHEPLGGQLGRGDGAGGEQEGERGTLLGQRRHQRQHGVGLADAGGMEPGEAAIGSLRRSPGRSAPDGAMDPPCRAARAGAAGPAPRAGRGW